MPPKLIKHHSTHPNPINSSILPTHSSTTLPSPSDPSGPSRQATEQFAQSVHLVEGFADTLDSIPPSLTRSLSDLKELDAVLNTPLRQVHTLLDRLLGSILNPESMKPDQRLTLLRSIVGEIEKYKLGGDDKIRVANGTCESLSHHIRQLDTTMALIISSLPPSLEKRIPASTFPTGYPKLTGSLRSKPSGSVWCDTSLSSTPSKQQVFISPPNMPPREFITFEESPHTNEAPPFLESYANSKRPKLSQPTSSGHHLHLSSLQAHTGSPKRAHTDSGSILDQHMSMMTQQNNKRRIALPSADIKLSPNNPHHEAVGPTKAKRARTTTNTSGFLDDAITGLTPPHLAPALLQTSSLTPSSAAPPVKKRVRKTLSNIAFSSFPSPETPVSSSYPCLKSSPAPTPAEGSMTMADGATKPHEMLNGNYPSVSDQSIHAHLTSSASFTTVRKGAFASLAPNGKRAPIAGRPIATAHMLTGEVSTNSPLPNPVPKRAYTKRNGTTNGGNAPTNRNIAKRMGGNGAKKTEYPLPTDPDRGSSHAHESVVGDSGFFSNIKSRLDSQESTIYRTLGRSTDGKQKQKIEESLDGAKFNRPRGMDETLSKIKQRGKQSKEQLSKAKATTEEEDAEEIENHSPGSNDTSSTKVYCICDGEVLGERMVACDNVDCPIEWFHYQCAGLTEDPTGSWFCAECKSKGFGSPSSSPMVQKDQSTNSHLSHQSGASQSESLPVPPDQGQSGQTTSGEHVVIDDLTRLSSLPTTSKEDARDS